MGENNKGRIYMVGYREPTYVDTKPQRVIFILYLYNK